MFCRSIMLYLFKFSMEFIQVTECRMLVSPVLTHKGHWRIKMKFKLCTLQLCMVQSKHTSTHSQPRDQLEVRQSALRPVYLSSRSPQHLITDGQVSPTCRSGCCAQKTISRPYRQSKCDHSVVQKIAQSTYRLRCAGSHIQEPTS